MEAATDHRLCFTTVAIADAVVGSLSILSFYMCMRMMIQCSC